MFGAGWTEMLIIGIVALVVIGPKDLPVVMRKLGRVVRTVRRMGEEFQSELSKTTGLDQITDLKRSITEPLRQTSDEIMREFNRQTSTGVEPTGIMKPTDPKVESVYDQIAATSGLTPASAASSAVAEALPAPVEAAPIVAKPRRARKSTKAASESIAAETIAVAEPVTLAPGETAVAETEAPVVAAISEPVAKPRVARARKTAVASPAAAVSPPAVSATPKRTPRRFAQSPASRSPAKKA